MNNISVNDAFLVARNAVNDYFESIVNVEEDDEEEFNRFFQSISLAISRENDKLNVSFVPSVGETTTSAFSLDQLKHISKAIEAAQAAVDKEGGYSHKDNSSKTRRIRYVFLLSNLLPATLDLPSNVHPSSQALQIMRETASKMAVEELENLVNTHKKTVSLTLAHEEIIDWEQAATVNVNSTRFLYL